MPASRKSAVASLQARGMLTDPQLVAAVRFENAFLTVAGGGMASVDLEDVRVDGGRNGDAMPAARLDAARRLHEARHLLGERQFNILTAVTAHAMPFRALGYGSDRQTVATLTSVVKWSLDDLSRRWCR